MPRTCSRIKLSASPKPASGPVLGLTWPILMTRLWALAGMIRSTAGAATAPRPARTSVRREMPERRSCDASLRISVSLSRSVSRFLDMPGERSSIGGASLLEMVQHLGPQCGLRVGTPGAKAFARFEAEFTVVHQPLEVRGWMRSVVDIGQHRFVDGQRQIGADEIGVLERTQDREPPAEARLDDGIHGLCIANPALDQGDRLPPQGVLQAVADEAGHVLFDMHRHFARRFMQRHGPVDRLLRRPFCADHLHQRHEIGWIPPVGAERARAVDRKSTRLNSSHVRISYAVFCLKKKKNKKK